MCEVTLASLHFGRKARLGPGDQGTGNRQSKIHPEEAGKLGRHDYRKSQSSKPLGTCFNGLIRFHLQNTKSKTKLLTILRWGMLSIKLHTWGLSECETLCNLTECTSWTNFTVSCNLWLDSTCGNTEELWVIYLGIHRVTLTTIYCFVCIQGFMTWNYYR